VRKILLIRFSSIGDVVLTTPVITSLRACFPDAEIHFLTKAAIAPLLDHHPGLSKLHRFEGDLGATLRQLRAERFDLVLDLHNSLRSRILRLRLGVRSVAYRKGSLRTRLFTRWRIGSVERIHVVERYEETLKRIGCAATGKPSELHLPAEALDKARRRIDDALGSITPIAANLGGKFATKKWIPELWAQLLNQLGRPVVLLGADTEVAEAALIQSHLKVPFLNAVNNTPLVESAALVAACGLVITHDSGLMHVAAALGKPIVSIWGHSVPSFGFTPWKTNAAIVETQGLACRPCSKLGHDACPKGHFKCMREITPEQVMRAISEVTQKGGNK
jgi:heptosyltransferase-2